MGARDCGAGRRSCLHYRGLVAGEPEAWRASKSKGLEKRGTCGAGLEKRGGRTCGAWKSMGLEKQLDCEPGKAEVREGEGLTTTGDMMRAGDWRQGTGGKENGKEAGGSGRRSSRRQRQPNGGGVLFFLRSPWESSSVSPHRRIFLLRLLRRLKQTLNRRSEALARGRRDQSLLLGLPKLLSGGAS